MAWNSDIYLLLYRQQGSYEEIEANAVTAAMVLLTLTKGMIIGDSLDAPFMGFIKVESVGHKISFGSTQTQLDWAESHQHAKKSFADLDEQRRSLLEAGSMGPMARPFDQARVAPLAARAKRIEDAYAETVKKQRNAFINSHLPEQGEFTFSKHVDRATPQLAYGCSVQERFPVALFFFRKKIGLGLGGIRIPYLTVGLRKCRISSYEMKDESEEISLKYADIAWAALGQIADTNFPFPVPSARIFDCETYKGGETYSKGWAYGVQAIGAAMSLVAGAVTAGIKAGRGDGSYG